ncbi:hypothetical protein [Nitrososphaera viennensis]|uniref:Uncharacterized protein n=2 Tax=Nitrososphaera viennensis TaxID=1034015 RepID=A0A060HGB4_9ARCH|nr:hypothetical protein [Nitrososphaera viennensis]AIC15669.1 hypothetical protein NVIE_014290 [Nitrososphaera viennensis EN76]UVS70542.1 hypothetical protein NWT39_07090 [Nitrososphaera viennensis]
MQTGSNQPVQEATASKPLVFGLTAAIVVGIIAPLVLPHVTHPSMLSHILLHIASLVIASFLSIVSLTAYRRTGGARTLYMTLGFIALGIAEVFYLFQAVGLLFFLQIPNLDIEFPHIIVLAMLSLFGLGVLKVNK